MAYGIYTAPERVVRDGALVCFKGERMTVQEADRRGLVPKKAAADPEGRRAELEAMTVKQLEEVAEAAGAEHANGATKAAIIDAIVEKERG